MLTTAQIKWLQNNLEDTSFTEEQAIENLNKEFGLSLSLSDISHGDWANVENVVTYCSMCGYWVNSRLLACYSGYEGVDCEVLSYDECYKEDEEDE